MASNDFEKERVAFREFFNDNAVLHHDASLFFQSLITAILKEVKIEFDSVASRVKEREECIAKFSRKYRENIENEKKEYEIKDWITDLIGLRVVCLYEPDIYQVEKILIENFELVDETDKKKDVESMESQFGYKGVHLDLKLGSERKKFLEYQRYKNLQFEVQIRSISQDAWSTLDHKIKYKKNIPHNLKRRINRLAALFELADQEFVLIRDSAKEEILKGKELASSSTTSTEIPIDVFGFLAIVQKYYPTYSFIEDRSDEFLQEILQHNPNMKTSNLAEALKNKLDIVVDYKMHAPFKMNPFTEIRHSLFLNDQEKYKNLLFPSQRGTFKEWLKSSKKG